MIYLVIPAVILQYGLTIFCLIKLLFLDLPKKKFWTWNFFILLAIGIGVITFAVCYLFFKKQVFPNAKANPQTPEAAPTSQTTEENKTTPAEKPPAQNP